MSDGVRLAATLYMPDDDTGPWPAILELLPYRKDDWTLERDLALYPYVVDRGYVGARVDIRGTGRSEGGLPDGEYSDQELEDAVEVIAWLASRPWSTGSVGMWGISWGGFNAIQVAALHAPPALQAIVAVDASDDLFHDDIHYIDGIWHLDEYEIGVDLWNAVSPAPDFPVDEDTLNRRFDAEPWLLSWLRHQRDGPFWRRASLAPDYDRLRIPALLVGGWLDGYRDSIARMLTHVPGTRAIVGPWNHAWPHQATPGPEIEWRREAVRWWDHWLKGRNTGLQDEPRLAAYVRTWHPPDPGIESVPGSWRWEDWPPHGSEDLEFRLTVEGGLDRRPRGPAGAHALPYRPSAGVEAGPWWGEPAPDQRALDDACLVFETDPLPDDLAILGLPRITLDAEVDAPVAHFFARLSDVAPDGRVTLVTGGGANGAHRRSRAEPEALEPGVRESIEVPLRFTSWVYPAGHRIRVAISNHLWPMMWPSPRSMTMIVHSGRGSASRLRLPVIPISASRSLRFDPPVPAPPPEGVGSRGELLPVRWSVARDGDTVTASWEDRAEAWFPWGRFDSSERLAFTVADPDPGHAAAEGGGDIRVSLPGRTVTWETELDLRSDPEIFRYRFRRTLAEEGAVIRERDWEATIPRDFQ
jgi:putative CocE/NonD family hydrolase